MNDRVDAFFSLGKTLLYVLFSLLFSFCPDMRAEGNQIHRFRRVSPEWGFYHEGIASIATDKAGFLWFHSEVAVYRYNGYKIEKMEVPHSDIVSTTFYSLISDKEGTIWIGTNHGVFFYEEVSRSFVRGFEDTMNVRILQADNKNNFWMMAGNKAYFFDKTSNSIKHYPIEQSITTLYTLNDEVYIGAEEGRIYVLDPASDRFTSLCVLGKHTIIKQIIKHQDNLYFISERQGVFQLDLNTKKVSPLVIDKFHKDNNVGRTLYIDEKEQLWVGTLRGLFVKNLKTNESFVYKNNPNDKFSLPNNSIWSIVPDQAGGGIWIGTYSGGLAYTNKYDHPFLHLSFNDELKSNINFVSVIVEDKKGNLWLGTEGAGYLHYDRKTGDYRVFSHSERNSLANDNVKSIVIDKNENLYLASFTGGLNKIDKYGHVSHYGPSDSVLPISHSNIYHLYLDKDNNLWTGSQASAVDHINLSTNKIQRYAIPRRNRTGLYFNVFSFMDADSLLYIASNDGLYCLDKNSGQVVTRGNNCDYALANCDRFFCMTQDNEKGIWVGSDKGLCYYNAANDSLTSIASLDDIIVYSMLHQDGSLWLGTGDGLVRYDIKTAKVDIYKSDDGIQGNLFYPNAATKLSTGELAFGGTNGVTIFHPRDITSNPVTQPPVILDVFVNNKKVPDFNHTINLNYKQKVILIDFTVLNYLMPEKNKFSYTLTGVSKDWTSIPPGERQIVFADLPVGKYEFVLRASNSDGIFSEQTATVKFVIVPPPWKTWWAYLIYIVLGLCIGYLLVRYFRQHQEHQIRIRLEQLERKKMEEINQMKIEFFTNISHEFKTPLTLIINPMKSLLEDKTLSEKVHDKIRLINRNAIRLQTLIGELLDFRQLEKKHTKINNTTGHIVDFLFNIFSFFREFADEYRITYLFEKDRDDLVVSFDRSKVEKIFFNLLSNAFKYTQSAGTVVLSIEGVRETSSKHEMQIRVTNSGGNLTQAQIDSMFDPYVYTEATGSLRQKSNGIGLTYVKELVNLLGGRIEVQNENGDTSFVVYLPFENAGQTEDANEPYSFEYTTSRITQTEMELNISENKSKNDNGLPAILIADDEIDLQVYLSNELSGDYQVHCCSNGEEAMELFKKKQFDLVLSDVMMPVVSGIQLCSFIKSELMYSHIPVVLLSAASSMDKKVEGLKAGADVYIEKPFDIDYLRLQINNLITSRESSRQNFSKKIDPTPEQAQGQSVDDEFIKQAIAIIEEHIDDTEFGVQEFINEMGVGRTVLYSKVKKLTDMSVNEFIVNIKLKKGAMLLKTGQYNVSEVAFMVGFNDPKYFSTCFRKLFNESPKSYSQKKE